MLPTGPETCRWAASQPPLRAMSRATGIPRIQIARLDLLEATTSCCRDLPDNLGECRTGLGRGGG